MKKKGFYNIDTCCSKEASIVEFVTAFRLNKTLNYQVVDLGLMHILALNDYHIIHWIYYPNVLKSVDCNLWC